MVRGQQKELLTPGQNKKKYLAGALNTRTGEWTGVESDSKNSPLFIQPLWNLHERYPDAWRIHVILDNYSIHTPEEVTNTLVAQTGRRFELHFLPPYCPDHNEIERVWQYLHANVTWNYTCRDLSRLMDKSRAYLRRRNGQLTQYATGALRHHMSQNRAR